MHITLQAKGFPGTGKTLLLNFIKKELEAKGLKVSSPQENNKIPHEVEIEIEAEDIPEILLK